MTSGTPKFRSVIFDIDSTLSAIEGIDWLASLRGREVRREVSMATQRAMQGEISLDSVYAHRLSLIKPTRREVEKLATEYIARAERGSHELLAKLTNAGLVIHLISGGLLSAVLPLTRRLSVPETHVHAVQIFFNDDGTYAGFDEKSPLTRDGGKAEVVRRLDLERPIAAVGDGNTDLDIRTSAPPAADAFIAYTGVILRANVVRQADFVVSNLESLAAVLLA